MVSSAIAPSHRTASYLDSVQHLIVELREYLHGALLRLAEPIGVLDLVGLAGPSQVHQMGPVVVNPIRQRHRG